MESLTIVKRVKKQCGVTNNSQTSAKNSVESQAIVKLVKKQCGVTSNGQTCEKQCGVTNNSQTSENTVWSH